MPVHPDGQPHRDHSPKTGKRGQHDHGGKELLSLAILDMSGHVSGNSTPKRPNPMVLLTPPPHKLRDLSGLVDMSSQVSTPDDAKMAEASLEEIPSLTVETPGPSSGTAPSDASYL